MFSSSLFIPLMYKALLLARASLHEVPIGAVVYSAEYGILGTGTNSVIQYHDPTAHAEILALREAGKRLQNYRITNSLLIVTLEPCSMCVSAAIHARVAGIIYGASSQKTGALGSVFSLHTAYKHNHTLWTRGGILEEECKHLIQTFFQSRRESLPSTTKKKEEVEL